MLNAVFTEITLLLMAYGCMSDILHRKFPNWILLSVLMAGSAYALYAGHLISSWIMLLLINGIGVWMFNNKIAYAGDCKFLSACVLLFDPFSWAMVIFLIRTLILSILFHGLQDDGGLKSVFTEIKDTILSMSCYFYGLKPVNDPITNQPQTTPQPSAHPDNHSQTERKSLPFTVTAWMSLVLTLLNFA